MITADEVSIGLTVGTQPPLRRIRLQLRVARVLRYDVAWTIDHFVGFFPSALWDEGFSWLAATDSSPHAFFDYQALLGHLASRAGGLQLGVGVTEPIRRHPVLIAQTMMTLAHATRRTPILGIGSGERENVEPYGLDFTRPVARLEEALQIIRACFESEGGIDFQGAHFRLDNARMDLLAPRKASPPIWIASHRPRMLRLTGEYGDGWYPTLSMTPAGYEEALRTIRTHAGAVGRDGGRIVPGWQAFAVLARSERAARKLLDTKAVRFMALLAPDDAWQHHGMTHPLGAGFGGLVDFVPEEHGRKELDAAVAAVPVDLLAEEAVWGTPETVLEQFSEYVEAGLRHLVVQPVAALVSRADALYNVRAMVQIQRRLRRRGVPSSLAP